MSETETAPISEEKHTIPLDKSINVGIDDALDSMDKIRETKKGGKKNQPLPENMGEGEETAEQKTAREVTEKATSDKLTADTETAKKHGGEKIDEKGNVVDATGKVVKTVEEINAKPKKAKFWKKEEKVPATNGAAPAETVPTETNFDFNKLPKEIQDRLKRADALEEIINRPSVKTVLKAEESGKDYNTFRDELESKNPMRMTYEDIYKIQLERDGYSATEQARKLERFNEKDEDDQADIITHTRKELKAEFDKGISEWTPTFEKQENPIESAFTTLASEIPAIAKEIENKEFLGVQITPERLKVLMNISKPIIKIDPETGRIDPQDFIRVKHIVENFDLIAETIEEQTRLEVTEEFNTRYNLPLSAETGNHSPQPRQEQAHSSKRKEDMKELSM